MGLPPDIKEHWELFISEQQAEPPAAVAQFGLAFMFMLRHAPFSVQLAALPFIRRGEVKTREDHNHFVAALTALLPSKIRFRLRIPPPLPLSPCPAVRQITPQPRCITKLNKLMGYTTSPRKAA